MASRLDEHKIAQRYGKALFGAALEKDQLESVQEDLKQVNHLLGELPDLYAFFTSPNVRLEEKQQLLTEQFQGTVGELVVQLLAVMVNNDRIKAFPALVTAYDQFLEEHQNVTTAEVTTAVRLDAKTATKIRKTLAKEFGYKEVTLVKHVNPDILGGAIIRLNDQVIDGSFKGRLDALREKVIQA